MQCLVITIEIQDTWRNTSIDVGKLYSTVWRVWYVVRLSVWDYWLLGCWRDAGMTMLSQRPCCMNRDRSLTLCDYVTTIVKNRDMIAVLRYRMGYTLSFASSPPLRSGFRCQKYLWCVNRKTYTQNRQLQIAPDFAAHTVKTNCLKIMQEFKHKTYQ